MKDTPQYYAPGDWNAVCSMCGRTRKASELVQNWQGAYRCPEHNEPRHPQDFVRAVPDEQTPPWVQPPTQVFTRGNVTLTTSAATATPDITDSTGTLTWTITIPEGVLIGTLTLENLPGGTVIINVFGGLERVLNPFGTTYTVRVFSGGALVPATVASITPSSATVLVGAVETYTVSLTGARSYDATVTLSSSDPTVATVPASVSISAGQKTATFNATAVAPGTAVFTATLNGTATASLTIESKVVSLTPTPTTVTIGGTRIMTVTLDAAPAVNTVVDLSSSNSGIVSVPASVTVLSGATTATFNATGVAGGSATLTATLNGTATASISAAFTLVVAADAINYNVYVEFTSLYTDPPPANAVVQITINAGVVVSGNGLAPPFRLAGPLLVWPGTPVFTLVNNGHILGLGGAGGNGAIAGTGLPGSAGSAGTDAAELDGYAITIDNGSGFIWGGGGGGGGGGEGGGRDSDLRYGRGGSGGGGGGAGTGTASGGGFAGTNIGAVGWTDDVTSAAGGTPAGPVTARTGGLGGVGAAGHSTLHPTSTAAGGTGGNGGDYGAAGSSGNIGTTANLTDVTVTAGGAGGAAGKAISLSGGTATFTSGSSSPHVKGVIA